MQNQLSLDTKTAIINSISGFREMGPRDQEIVLVKAIIKNFYWYCERNLAIRTKKGAIVPFELNWAQKKLVEAVMQDLINGVPVRYIILKARQMGFSTVIEALCFWWTTTHRNVTSIIMAHEAAASQNLYEMFRRYYEHAHPSFRPDLKYNTRSDLVFDIEDEMKARYAAKGERSPGLASQIKTMVAREGKGRSFTASFFHGSEAAYWEDANDVVSGVMQAIPLEPDTFEFLESTANGVGGYFYTEWQAAKKGESIFKPLFFAWHEHDGYELDGVVESLDEEERELLEIFKEKGYPEVSWKRKLAWRRLKMKEYSTDPAKFYQDYPKDDMEAFLASGRPVFDQKALLKMDKIAQSTEPEFAEIAILGSEGSRPSFKLRMLGKRDKGQDLSPLKIWEQPDPKAKYVIAVDTAEGKMVNGGEGKQNDYSVIDVMKLSNLKTVARWHGHIDPDLLGEQAFGLGTLYNTALIGVEVNNHGLTTVQYLRNHFYRNLYMRETSDEDQFQERTSQMGFKTNRANKPKIIGNLAAAIREGDIIDLDPVFVSECMTYARDDEGRTNARPGCFDDTVMAKAINLEMANYAGIDVAYAKNNIFKPTIYGQSRPKQSSSVQSLKRARAAHQRAQPVARRSDGVIQISS